MNTITKYVAKVYDTRVELNATTFDDAISELYDAGYVNCGKVQLLKVVYQEISCTPFIVDTTYRSR